MDARHSDIGDEPSESERGPFTHFGLYGILSEITVQPVPDLNSIASVG